MEHFCIGSYVRMLTSCAVSAERKFDPFCEKIMLALCPDGSDTFSYTDANGGEVIYTYPNFNKIHSAGQNLPTEVTRMAAQKGSGNIQKYFVKEIIPCLDESRKKNAVLAIKNVILKDKGIPDSTQLGTIRELTKAELRKKNDFVLSEFLVEVKVRYDLWEPYNGSQLHKNIIIADTLEAIEEVLLFRLSNYFLRFSEEYKRQHPNEPFTNDWHEFVEYGTTNKLRIILQRSGYKRESTEYIRRNAEKYVKDPDSDDLNGKLIWRRKTGLHIRITLGLLKKRHLSLISRAMWLT